MGVMPDICKVIAVLVIAGVGAFDSVNLVLQPALQSGIGIFHFHKVAVLGGIRRSKHAV